MFTILLIIFLLSILFILISKYTYFDDRKIPGLRPQLFYGNLLQTGIANKKDSLANALAKFQQNYGDVFQFYNFSTRLLVFNTIEAVQEIYKNATTTLPRSLLGIRNDEWKRHARIIEPLVKRSALTQYFDQILRSTDQLIDTWTSQTKANQLQTNVINQCQQLLLKIMLTISYGEENNEYLMNVVNKCNQWSSWSIFNGLNVRLIHLYVKYINRDYQHARQQIRNLINGSRNNNERSNTLLQSLIRSPLSSDELLDEILMINIGVDDVSTALSWFIHYMTKYPNIQEKLQLEIRQHPGHFTNDLIDQLQYIDLVIKEILRHSAISDISIRTIVSHENNGLNINGIQLHSGDSIAIAASNLHHDRRYWKIDPSLFYPERFLENDKDHSPYAYLPFGIGHYRSCPGKYLALYQLKIICVRLMQRVTFIDGDSQDTNTSVRTKGGGFVGLTDLAVYIKLDERNQDHE